MFTKLSGFERAYLIVYEHENFIISPGLKVLQQMFLIEGNNLCGAPKKLQYYDQQKANM